MTKVVLVLGGYGNFGRRIVAALALEPDVRVLIAGRDQQQCSSLAGELKGNTEPFVIDLESTLDTRMREARPVLVIHTAGPFQNRNHHVAQTCIRAGAHYVDLADGRDFVASIDALDAEARSRDVLVVSGASSVPALSSAVIDQFLDRFERLDTIEHGISSGAKPPGVAAMRGVLSYVGKPFRRWENGMWRTVYGWQNIRLHRFSGAVGRRWLANCDVPDLALFPRRYRTVRTVRFRAGVGIGAANWGVWLLSWLVRARVVQDAANQVAWLHKTARFVEPLGTRWSGMCVMLEGIDRRRQSLRVFWELQAAKNQGPIVPCLPAIALSRKILRGELAIRGAQPCMGLLSLHEILTAVPNLDLAWSEVPA